MPGFYCAVSYWTRRNTISLPQFFLDQERSLWYPEKPRLWNFPDRKISGKYPMPLSKACKTGWLGRKFYYTYSYSLLYRVMDSRVYVCRFVTNGQNFAEIGMEIAGERTLIIGEEH